MKRSLILLSFILFVVSDIKANFKWARMLGGPSSTAPSATAVDAWGNVYTVGLFWGTADFDPGAGVFNLTSASNTHEVFISKLDSSGNFVWAKSVASSVYGNSASGIAVDASGNVYVTGYFNSTADFDPGPATYNLTGYGMGCTFVLKLNTLGSFLWAKAMGPVVANNTGALARGNALTVDASNNVYVTGSFRETVDFDPGPGSFNVTAKSWFQDVFVTRLDALGNLVWVKTFGGAEDDDVSSVKLDPSGNIYTVGWVKDSTVDFDPGQGTFNITPVGQNIFISKLDTSGNFKWAKTFVGTFSLYSVAVALDQLGHLYAGGGFDNTIDFDPGPGIYNLNANSGSFWTSFVVKLDTSGAFIWARKLAISNSVDDEGMSIAVDTANDVYTLGNVNYGQNEGVFIHKTDKLGNAVWEKSLTTGGQIWGMSMAINKIGYIFSTGYFVGTTDFDPGPNAYNLTSPSNTTVSFVQKMSSCPRLKVDLITAKNVSCHGLADGAIVVAAAGNAAVTYKWMPGGATSPTATGLKAGTHTCIVTNICGDTVMLTVNITQPPAINTTIGFSAASMTSNQNGATYQWINCSGFQPISGATAQSYTAPSPGSYAVIVTVDSCSDTSACINITAAEIDNLSSYNPVAIYPNPNNGSFTIELKVNTQMIITDALGREIVTQSLHTGKNNMDMKDHPPGLYFVKLLSSSGQTTIKMLVNK